ncbi:MAG: YIP1 family protein [Chthoniobacterales bacterium]
METIRVKIHLNRGGQSLGQFTPEEVRAGYREGKFTGTDLAWRDGMPVWKPLAEVIDELAPEAASGADAPAPPVPAVVGIPWERRAEIGFFPGLFETIRAVLLEPSKAFGGMPITGGLGAPLFFFVLVGSIGGLAGFVYQAVLNSISPASTPQDEAMMALLGSTAVIGGSIMIMPVILAAVAFVTSGLIHLALMVIGGANRPVEATFRVVSYSGGATAVLQLLPVCGAFAATIWNFIVMVIGISTVHKIGTGRAAVAVLLPTLVCCGLILAAVFALVAAAGGMAVLLEQAARQQ